MNRVPQFFRVKFQRSLRGRKFSTARFAFYEQHSAAGGQDGEIRFAERPTCPLGHAAVQRNPTALPARIKNLLMEARFAHRAAVAIGGPWRHAAEEMRIEPRERWGWNWEIHAAWVSVAGGPLASGAATGTHCQLFFASASIVALACSNVTSVL